MIYILEDDENIRGLIEYALTGSGFECRGFGTPSQFFSAVRKTLPSLVLLDIMLPEEDGLSVLKKLRGAPETKKIPVIMLTAKGTEYDKVVGLDMGADDYVTKPFGILELISRIKAQLRRFEERGVISGEYSFGELYVSADRHTVTVSGEEVPLTYKEFELLLLLISNAGKVMTRDRILSQIWGFEFDGESRTVDVHIRTLRAKLRECGNMIETVRGIGYKFNAGGEKA